MAEGGTGAAGLGFPGEELFQEEFGIGIGIGMKIERERREETGDGVDEWGGMGWAIHGTGGPEGGGTELVGGQPLQMGEGVLEGIGGVIEVGAEGDDDGEESGR